VKNHINESPSNRRNVYPSVVPESSIFSDYEHSDQNIGNPSAEAMTFTTHPLLDALQQK
jgi:hypothetical protein